MRLQRLISAVWFGSAVFLMLAASAAFRAAGNPTVAADVVGSMLTRWHYIALAAPLALFVMELRHARRLMVVLLFTALVLAALQSFVDLRIRAIRAVSPVPISDLDREDPVRRRFGMLHGLSMMLLALQAVAAGVVVMKKEELPMSNFGPEPEDPTIYRVVMNEQEQYSIWPADREPLPGWRDAGFQGSKEECLQYIEKVWTGMRPQSLRDELANESDDTTGGGP